MCNNLVKVIIGAVTNVPYATPAGKLKYRKEHHSWEHVMLRCGHNLTDAEREEGYRPFDEFGRPVLCEDHAPH